MLTPSDLHDAHASFTRTLADVDAQLEKAEQHVTDLRNLREYIMQVRTNLDAKPPQMTLATASEIEETRRMAAKLAK